VRAVLVCANRIKPDTPTFRTPATVWSGFPLLSVRGVPWSGCCWWH